MRRELDSRKLCLAGGVFLNCALNRKVLRSGLFEEIHIVPAAADDGQSIGAAFSAYNQACGRATRSGCILPFLGLRHSEREIRKAVISSGLNYEKLDGEELANRIVSCLVAGKVVGVLRGRSELGPRALCHRSLLADPRSRSLRDRLNRAIKRREMFRPFAPVVALEDQDTFFDLELKSPFMLFSGKVKRQFRRSLYGITHVDGSARVQALGPRDDPFIHRLLKLFQGATGFPILLNTSFNGRGEPIVESPVDAIASFRANGIDILVLENFFIAAT